MLNAEANSGFSSVGSDHRIVAATIRLSLRKKGAAPKKKYYDCEAFTSDNKMQELYAVEVRNRFQPLEDEAAYREISKKFIRANMKAREKLIPTSKKRKNVRLTEDYKIVKARHEVKES